MEILGIGVSEIIFILLIAIIFLGPKDMQKTGRTIGRWLNRLVRSDGWKVFQRTSTELRNLPRNLMREANMEDIGQELQGVNKEVQEVRQTIDPRPPSPAATTTTSRNPSPSKQSDPTPQPPAVDLTDTDSTTKQDD